MASFLCDDRLRFPILLKVEPDPQDPSFSQWQIGQLIELNGLNVMIKQVRVDSNENRVECNILVDLVNYRQLNLMEQ